jgi:hypothetical protein
MLFGRKNVAVETPRKLRKTTLRILIADDHDASILEDGRGCQRVGIYTVKDAKIIREEFLSHAESEG